MQPQEIISPQDIPGQLDNRLQIDLPGSDFECTSSELEPDSDDDDINVQEFCASCLREPEAVFLERCTRCTTVVLNASRNTGVSIKLHVP